MSKLPYMQFYPADWLQDTQILSLEAQGAWMKILCALHIASERGRKTWATWELKQFLGYPEGDRALILVSNLCSVADISARDEDGNHAETFQDAVEVTITSRRMVRDEANRIAELERKRRYEDKNPTRHRRSSDANTTRRVQSSDIRDQSKKERIKKDRNAPPNGVAENLLPGLPSATGKKKVKTDSPAGFDEWWNLWPKKDGKADAKKWWVKLHCHEDPPHLKIMIAARWEQHEAQEGRGQYCKAGDNFLKGERWNDEKYAEQEQEENRPPPKVLKREGNDVTLEGNRHMKGTIYDERYPQAQNRKSTGDSQ